MVPLVLLLLTAATRVLLVDEPFEIPAHDWRFDSDLGLHQRAANLIAQYQVQTGGNVRLLLMTRENVDLMSEGRNHSTMAVTHTADTGFMRYNVSQPGDYALVVDNRDNDRPARVHLKVWLDFPSVTTISPQRQLTVILLSFAFFFGIVTWSTRRLWKNMRL